MLVRILIWFEIGVAFVCVFAVGYVASTLTNDPLTITLIWLLVSSILILGVIWVSILCLVVYRLLKGTLHMVLRTIESH